MNKTTKTKVVVSALLAIVLCVSLVAGATYALFTSESRVNIAVTSGKVDLVASVDGVSLYSPAGIDLSGNIVDATNTATTTTFGNGGGVLVTDNTITLSDITPGDQVSFNIIVTNNSSVDVKYRTVISCESDNGLFAGLVVTIGGTTYTGATQISDYAYAQVGQGNQTIPVTIQLPATAGNVYQGKSCAISYKVESVQGNTATSDPESGVYEIYTASDLAHLSRYAADVTTIKLMNDIDMAGVQYTAWDLAIPSATTITFDGNGHTIKNLTTTGYTGDPANTAHFVRSGLIARVYSAATSSSSVFGRLIFKNLKMDNATVSNTVEAVNENVCAAAFVGYLNVANIEFDGCAVTNSHITSAKYAGGLVGYAEEYDSSVKVSVKNATIQDNEIVGNGHTAGLVGFANKTVSVDGASIKGNYINTQGGHSAAATLGTGSVEATGIVANNNVYVGGLKDCSIDKRDEQWGYYHKQLGDYTVVGTAQDNIICSYAIRNLADLKAFRDMVNAGTSFLHYTVGKNAESVPCNVVLLADIDLGNEEWTPIGTSANPFKGDFDGRGHTISNLKITSGTNVGLFGQITLHGDVNYLAGVLNLTLKNVTINADGSGAFVGNSYVTTQNAGNGGALVLRNLKLIGDVKIEGKDVGGIMGTEWTNFQINGYNITVDVNAGSYVKGTGTVGGVFASAPHAHINYITSNIPVYVSGANAVAGGIIGCAGWDVGCDSDKIDVPDGVTPDYSGSIICTGNVYATDIAESANGKYRIGKIIGSEANNDHWSYYRNPGYGSFFRNFTANNAISITLTNGTVLTSNGMTAADRHGASNAVDYTQSLVGDKWVFANGVEWDWHF